MRKEAFIFVKVFFASLPEICYTGKNQMYAQCGGWNE